MKSACKKLILTFLTFVALFALQRGVFVAIYCHLEPKASASQWFGAFLHGLPLDLSMGGYLTIIPAILIIFGMTRWSVKTLWPERVYYGLAALLLSVVSVLDIVLYSYWGQRLDYTPIFYFSTSPSAALASAGFFQALGGVTAILLLAAAIFWLLMKTVGSIRVQPARSWKSVAWMVPVTALLFLPIRGSLTVQPVNISKAYFCDLQRVNQSAINPAFNLMYSLKQQGDIDSQCRFMEPDKAATMVAALHAPVPTDSVAAPWLRKAPLPDVYIVILESFSSALFPSLGGEPVATGLDSLAREGIMFTNVFASGYRTDRAIPAIVSGFPAQPTISVMKYVDKAAHLPSIPHQLSPLGYRSTYYYGGDADFTNMKAYLINSGFSRIVCDKDFPVSSRLSKWGAPDHLLFEKALEELAKDKAKGPRLTVIQTSSSHEPFDVPRNDPRFANNAKLNAFAYVDHSAADFVKGLREKGLYGNALVIFVADHYGVYPENPEGPLARHHIPMIAVGGALLRQGVMEKAPVSQTDIAATLTAALGADPSPFTFSKDFFNPASPHFALFTARDAFGYVDAADTAVYNIDASRVTFSGGPGANEAAEKAKASLQHIYHTISRL